MLIAVLANAQTKVVRLHYIGQLVAPPLPCLTFFETFVLRGVEFPQGVLRCEDQQPHVTGNNAKGVVFFPTALLDGVTLLPDMLLDEAAGMDICDVVSAIQRGAK